MQTLEQSLSELVAAGALHHEVAAAASLFPHEVANRDWRGIPVVERPE